MNEKPPRYVPTWVASPPKAAPPAAPPSPEPLPAAPLPRPAFTPYMPPARPEPKSNAMTWAGVLGALVAAAVSTGVTVWLKDCGNGPKNFNNALVGMGKRLETAGFKFGSSLAPYFDGRASDPGPVNAALADARAALDSVKTEFNDLKVPPGSNARALHVAFRDFLAGQEEIINVHFVDLAAIAADDSMDGDEKAEAAADILQQAGALEQESLARVRSAQQAFAREHGAKIQ